MRIVGDDQLSYYDLLLYLARGVSVFSTPHLGNLHQGALALAQMGIPMYLYDRTSGPSDFRYIPHGLQLGGTFEQLAEPHVLTTHASVVKRSKQLPYSFGVGASMAETHLRSLQQVFPKTPMETFSAFLLNRKEIVLECLRLLTTRYPDCWKKQVTDQGLACTVDVKDLHEVDEIGIFGVTNMKSGLLIPNIWTLLLTLSLKGGEGESYYLTGPDMKRYLFSRRERIVEQYAFLCSHLDVLPRDVEVHVVRAIDQRLVCLPDQSHTLDCLVDGVIAVKEHRAIRKGELQKLSGTMHQNKVLELDAEERALTEDLKCRIDDCSIPFYDLRVSSTRVSQYDLLGDKKLYIHPLAMEMSFAEQRQLVSWLSDLEKQGRSSRLCA